MVFKYLYREYDYTESSVPACCNNRMTNSIHLLECKSALAAHELVRRIVNLTRLIFIHQLVGAMKRIRILIWNSVQENHPCDTSSISFRPSKRKVMLALKCIWLIINSVPNNFMMDSHAQGPFDRSLKNYPEG